MTFKRVYSGAPWEERMGYCRALRAPTTTMVEVSQLIDPQMLIEIEVDAVVAA